MKKVYDFVETICLSFVIVAILMMFVFRVANVSGSSMENTLNENDRIIVADVFYTPKCGDIIVTDESTSLNKKLVKRVIAVEGDKIVVDYRNACVYVNDILLNEDYIKEPMTIVDKDSLELIVPEGQVFVMGDNRNVSQDSRSEKLGTISRKCILGKVIFRLMPFSKI